MPETSKPSARRKKKPAWLTGEETTPATDRPTQPELGATTPPPDDTPSTDKSLKDGTSKRKIRGGGPLYEGDTTELPRARSAPDTTGTKDTKLTNEEAIPHLSAPASTGPGPNPKTNAHQPIIERLRSNPGPALLSVAVIIILGGGLWFFFFRGGPPETQQAEGGGEQAPLAQQPSPQAGGVDETGIVFSDLQVNGDEASLRGGGLEWEGSVIDKEDGAGQTITLEGPTAVQIERGFEVENSDVESGVYALAQEDGSVLHVATHTYQLVTEQKDSDGEEQIQEEITLGTIFDLSAGELDQHGFYVDRREEGSAKILRTYYDAPNPDQQNSYEVSLDAPRGAPVPLLVGYREQDAHNNQQGDGEE